MGTFYYWEENTTHDFAHLGFKGANKIINKMKTNQNQSSKYGFPRTAYRLIFKNINALCK